MTFNPRSPGHPAAHPIDSVAIYGIACPSPVQCVAIDHLGREVTFDPARARAQKIHSVDVGHKLASISCPAADQCTVVDRRFRELTFDQQSRRTVGHLQIDNARVRRIACPSRSFCVAVDVAGNALQGQPTRKAPRER